MSEQNNTNANTTVEDKLKDVLSGDALTNALDFVAHLRSIGMTPDENNRFYFMGEYTCILVFFPHNDFPDGMWFICDCPIEEYDGFPLDESLKEFARANVQKCGDGSGCGGDCGHEARRATKKIFGKEYNSLCSSEIQFFDPNAEALVKVKKLMDYWKLMIAEGKYKGR